MSNLKNLNKEQKSLFDFILKNKSENLIAVDGYTLEGNHSFELCDYHVEREYAKELIKVSKNKFTEKLFEDNIKKTKNLLYELYDKNIIDINVFKNMYISKTYFNEN